MVTTAVTSILSVSFRIIMRNIVHTEDQEKHAMLVDFCMRHEGIDLKESDQLEEVTNKVRLMGEAIKEFKAKGINMNVLNYYLRGRGVAQRDIDNVQKGVEQFFSEFNIDINDHDQD